jgi:hypothetical protein
VICPHCHSERCRRSKRRGARDFATSVVGLRPWRCRHCDRRFYAWSVALPFLFYAHCGKCGNLDLQRISREHVDGWSAGSCSWRKSPRIGVRLAGNASFRYGLRVGFDPQKDRRLSLRQPLRVNLT